ncbi:HepT-like ribonuclease domain-containing protein [Methanococcoides methylutens]|uniref:HepT-like ribonuclease domain-containing protein n=1 Tax=Methanococcoides methylutens TaxID=2226 RepID=UPI00404431D4
MKDPEVFIRHILDSIEKIEAFTYNKTEDDFFSDVQLQDATIRRIEIIGEASKNIPEEFKRQYQEIPWSEMARTRDKLIHGYFGVDLELTWDIIAHDLPELKTKIEQILEELKYKDEQ